MPTAQGVYMGLDCGGSTIRALAVDPSGGVIFRGHAGAANLATTPKTVLRDHLWQATDSCPDPTSAYGCFAGMLTVADRRYAEDLLRLRFPRARIGAAPDYAAAFMAAERGIDACVVAGTGALVCSKAAGGWVKSGGGGYLLGDEGSAFDLGRRLMRAFLDGSPGPSPTAVRLIATTFGATDANAIVAAVYASSAPAARLARLAPALVADADAGLPYAVEAVSTAMHALAAVTAKHVRTHGPAAGTVSLGLAGGVWKTSLSVLDVFAASIRDQLDRDFDVVRLNRPPVHGAVTLAKELSFGN